MIMNWIVSVVRTLCCLVLSVSSLACAAQAQTTDKFELKSATDDSTFELEKHKGKFIVLHFLLKTECPYCMRYTHDFAMLAEKDADTLHVFIKPDSNAEIQKWSKGLDKSDLAELPAIYRDPNAKLAKAFKIPDGYKFHGQSVHYPALVILDPDAKEVFRYVGKSNSDRMKPGEFSEKLAELQKSRSK
jgi:peroxiredoxin Q/BCP